MDGCGVSVLRHKEGNGQSVRVKESVLHLRILLPSFMVSDCEVLSVLYLYLSLLPYMWGEKVGITFHRQGLSMKGILNNRWIQGALSFILSFSMLYYEICHGVRNPWWTGMFIGCVLGLLYEDMRYLNLMRGLSRYTAPCMAYYASHRHIYNIITKASIIDIWKRNF